MTCVVTGSAGIGKSHLCRYLYTRHFNEKHLCIFIDYDELTFNTRRNRPFSNSIIHQYIAFCENSEVALDKSYVETTSQYPTYDFIYKLFLRHHDKPKVIFIDTTERALNEEKLSKEFLSFIDKFSHDSQIRNATIILIGRDGIELPLGEEVDFSDRARVATFSLTKFQRREAEKFLEKRGCPPVIAQAILNLEFQYKPLIIDLLYKSIPKADLQNPDAVNFVINWLNELHLNVENNESKSEKNETFDIELQGYLFDRVLEGIANISVKMILPDLFLIPFITMRAVEICYDKKQSEKSNQIKSAAIKKA